MYSYLNYAAAFVALVMAYITLDATRWGRLRYVGVILLVVLGALSLFVRPSKAADLVAGDSIARGTGHAMTGVVIRARTSAGSCRIAKFGTWRRAWNHVVLSAGINDDGACVAALRARVKAQRVIWVLPAPINRGRAAVQAAMQPGDRAVSYACAGGCTKSNFHPASYAAVARDVRGQW